MDERFLKFPLEVLSDTRLTLRDFKVLVVLQGLADGKGICNLTRATISSLTGVAENHISVATKRLVNFGWIEKVGDGGGSAPNTYRIRK